MLVYLFAAATTAAVLAVTYAWYWRPVIVVRMMMKFELFKIGMKVHYKNINGLKQCYAERGSFNPLQSSLIFLHGFSFSKNIWVSIVERLPKDLHIILVDAVGHGHSSAISDKENANLEFMVDALHDLLHSAGIVQSPLHLIGTSMGGVMAGIYCSKYPDDVEMVTMICPAVRTPISSTYVEELKKGKNFLLPRNVHDMQTQCEKLVYNRSKVSRNKQFLLGLLQLQEPNKCFYENLFSNAVKKTEEDFTKLIESIQKPTQLIWGENDELISISATENMKKQLPDCRRVDIIPKCGHVVMWDEPQLTTDYILQFRQSFIQKD